jgi:uncharacterized protein
MFISVKELKVEQREFDEHLRPGAIDLGPDIRQTAPLDTAGRAELVEEHRGGRQGTIADIRLVGQLATRLELACARCLEPVARDVERSFDLIFRPTGVDRRGDEVSIHEADTEIGYYSGDGLQLEDALREQVLLAVPLKAVCREDCKGLCPHCGRNLNQETCNCAAPVLDERWSALKDLKDKLQS